MLRLFRLGLPCLLLLLCLASQARAAEQGWGRLYLLTGSVPVHGQASDSSPRARLLKAGQRVRVDFQTGDWVAVFAPDERTRQESRAWGYARLDILKANAALDLPLPSPLPGLAKDASAPQPRAAAGAQAGEPQAKPGAAEPAQVHSSPASKPTPAKSEPAKPHSDKAKPFRPESAKVESAMPEPAKSEPAKSHSDKAQPAKQHSDKPEPAKTELPKASAKAEPAKQQPGRPVSSAGEIRVPDRNLAVRSERSAESEFRRLLRPGQRVRVGLWEDGWFAVFDASEKDLALARAWGFSRDKFLVPESAYSGPPPDASGPAPQVQGGADDEAQVAYTVLGRVSERRKPPVTILRVRLDVARPPAAEALRAIARAVWRAERRGDEGMELELYLSGMDPKGLSYASARFHDDGRLREFWWREVVLGVPPR